MKAVDGQGRTVELTKIAGECEDGSCPTIYRSDRRTAGVQGYTLRGEDAPDGEAVVEVPIQVLLEAARALR
jgi:hypothetical protein